MTTALGYEIVQPLNIPADNFSPQGIAVLLITGTCYGDCWVLNALPVYSDGPRDTIIGSIETDPAERDPERVLTAVRAWLEAYCEGTPFSLAVFESLNGQYGSREAPFFCSASAAIAIPMR